MVRNWTHNIQHKNYMKSSSSSSIDAELLPFDDEERLPFDDAETLPFDDEELLPFDDAEPGSGGMKISSSSSLSPVHKKVCFVVNFRYVSLLGCYFIHIPCNLRSSFRISSKVLEGHPLRLNAWASSFSRVSLLMSSSQGTNMLSTLKSAAKRNRHSDIWLWNYVQKDIRPSWRD